MKQEKTSEKSNQQPTPSTSKEADEKGGKGRKRAAEKPLPAIKTPKVQKTEKVEENKQVTTPVKQTVSKAKGVPKKNGKS